MLLVISSVALSSCAVKPSPLLPEERAEIIQQDQRALFAGQPPVDHPISLFEAMARALKYNLRHRTALLEKTVALTQADLTDFNILPKVAAEAGYSHRNKKDASSSFSITDNRASASFATSQDTTRQTGELSMVWNLLDFGVAAIQARQDWDRTLTSEELRRKTVHNLLRETRDTFWQAASAQKIAHAIDPVIMEAKQALADARKVEQERLRPQIEILRYQRTLIEIVRRLTELQDQLSRAKTEFAALINLPPGSDFQLEIPDDKALAIPRMRLSLEEMEMIALNNRPELREAMYTSRISADETRKAMLRLLPGLEISTALHHDGNSFTLNHQWYDAGFRVAWNLFNLLKGPTDILLAKNQEETIHMRRLTLHMAILTQVHLAHRHYFEQLEKLDDHEAISNIDQRILQNISVAVGADAQNQLERIHATTTAITSRLQLYQSFAQTQNAVGQIFVTLGVDLAKDALMTDSIPELTQKLRAATQDWNDGIASRPWHLPDLPGKARFDDLPVPPPAMPKYVLEVDDFTLPKSAEPSPCPQVEEMEKEFLAPNPDPDPAPQSATTPVVKPEPPQKQEEASQIPSTPPSAGTKPQPPPPITKEKQTEIWKTIHSWADAWSARDAQEYLSYYSKTFLPEEGISRKEWEQRIREVFKWLRFTQVSVEQLQLQPIQPGEIEVTFKQGYRSDRFYNVVRRSFVLIKEGTAWKILKQRSLPMEPDEKETAPSTPDGQENTTRSLNNTQPPYAVQAATLHSTSGASELSARLYKAGYSPYILHWRDQKNRLWYAVRVGPFMKLEEAVSIQHALVSQHMNATVVPGKDS